MIQSCHQDIRLANIYFVSRGGQGAISPPKSMNGGRPRWLIWMRRPTGDQEVAGSTPPRSATFFRGNHEIFSTVILSLPLIQEGQLSVSDERMCTIVVNRLED